MNTPGEWSGLRNLITLFVAWKSLLLLIACGSPGSGYDSSTRILFDQFGKEESKNWFTRILNHIAVRLTRWDGIYFTTLAQRGHVNEQDWAFSWALAHINDGIARVLFATSSVSPIVQRAVSGTIISHISHLLATVVLYQLALRLLPAYAPSRSRVAFTAASLHILSPAGLFLSAPYGESLFACLNFAGMLSYARAVQIRYSATPTSWTAEGVYTILSGVSFASAASIRGNGLLSGIIFAWDAVEALLQPKNFFRDIRKIRRFMATCIAGLLVGVGFVAPQFVAYVEYCTGGPTRPWCERTPPSIYSWVQEHYWGVGLFRYWTLSNLPLFLIAAPVLVLLLATSIICLWRPGSIMSSLTTIGNPREQTKQAERKAERHILTRFALPQLVLTGMTATSFHVQIVNRISSGYPLWYIVLAIAMQGARRNTQPTGQETDGPGSQVVNGDRKSFHIRKGKAQGFWGITRILPQKYLKFIVRVMVMYAIVQGGLYASFLPPA